MEEKVFGKNRIDSTSTEKPGLRNHEKSHEKVFIFERTSKKCSDLFRNLRNIIRGGIEKLERTFATIALLVHDKRRFDAQSTVTFSTVPANRWYLVRHRKGRKREKMAPWDFYPANFKETAPEGFFLVHTHALSPPSTHSNTLDHDMPGGGGLENLGIVFWPWGAVTM